MAQKLVKIVYTYNYAENLEGNFEDNLYMRENDFINYSNENDVCQRIVESFFNETDKSKCFKSIVKVERLGLRFI